MGKAVTFTNKQDLINIFMDGYIPPDWVCCFYYNYPTILLDCYLTKDLIWLYETNPINFKRTLFSIKEFYKAVLMPKYEFISCPPDELGE